MQSFSYNDILEPPQTQFLISTVLSSNINSYHDSVLYASWFGSQEMCHPCNYPREQHSPFIIAYTWWPVRLLPQGSKVTSTSIENYGAEYEQSSARLFSTFQMKFLQRDHCAETGPGLVIACFLYTASLHSGACNHIKIWKTLAWMGVVRISLHLM